MFYNYSAIAAIFPRVKTAAKAGKHIIWSNGVAVAVYYDFADLLAITERGKNILRRSGYGYIADACSTATHI